MDRVGGIHTRIRRRSSVRSWLSAHGMIVRRRRARVPLELDPDGARQKPIRARKLTLSRQTKARPGSGRVPGRGVAYPATRASCLVGRSLCVCHQDVPPRKCEPAKRNRPAVRASQAGRCGPDRDGARYRASAPVPSPASALFRCDSPTRGRTLPTAERQSIARATKSRWRVASRVRIADRVIESSSSVISETTKSRRRCTERCLGIDQVARHAAACERLTTIGTRLPTAILIRECRSCQGFRDALTILARCM